jgi:hypothetical protein
MLRAAVRCRCFSKVEFELSGSVFLIILHGDKGMSSNELALNCRSVSGSVVISTGSRTYLFVNTRNNFWHVYWRDNDFYNDFYLGGDDRFTCECIVSSASSDARELLCKVREQEEGREVA